MAVMESSLIAAAIKIGTPAVAFGAVLAQAITSDPISGYVGAGSQVVAWTVVGYFARALLTGGMVVRNAAKDREELERLIADYAALVVEMRHQQRG